MTTVRLTAAQAIVRYLQNQFIETEVGEVRFVNGMFAIFGHGNVAGLGEALYSVKDDFPTYRAHNEQGMAFTACAYAKQMRRHSVMACTTSIGPGATNLVTAAALAFANRLPLLLLPGDTFSSRTPDPVLQQIEHFSDPGVTVNDCLKPVSRYFDRIHRPEQLITSLPAAFRVLLDPEDCGPVTLALPQDVQTMAFDYPAEFLERRVNRIHRMVPYPEQLGKVADLIRHSQKPVIIAGGGVHYSGAMEQLQSFAENFTIGVAETQAGKGALPWNHPLQLGSVGVTGSSAANKALQRADLVIAIGTRLQDFTTGSRSLFKAPLISINAGAFDAVKHSAVPLQCDAQKGLEGISRLLDSWRSENDWSDEMSALISEWRGSVELATTRPSNDVTDYLPTDAEVIGAVQRQASEKTTVVCAAGGLPGELHKLWCADNSGAYHVEYGYSTMGYEIAGGLGVKMAAPDRDVVVMVGDGSYLMLNSEIATSVMLGYKLTIVVLDNRGFGCINRLQQACGGAPFNNLLSDCLTTSEGAPKTDFAAHARALGAEAVQVATIEELESALQTARSATRTFVIALDTDPVSSTRAGGHWWEVAVPEVSEREQVKSARKEYLASRKQQPY